MAQTKKAPKVATSVSVEMIPVLRFNDVPSKEVREAMKGLKGEYLGKRGVWATDLSIDAVNTMLAGEAKAEKAAKASAKASAPKAVKKNVAQVFTADQIANMLKAGLTEDQIAKIAFSIV